MPSQASTPRTTRNSRGLRENLITAVSANSEITGSTSRTATGRIPKRARARKSQTTSSITNALAPAIITEQAFGCAADALSKVTSPSPSPRTPRPATLETVTQPPQSSAAQTSLATIFREAQKSAEPSTPETLTPTQRIPETSVESAAAGVVVKAPRQITPESPGYETTESWHRKALEGEEFARELYYSVRNDHFMRGCQCPIPTIYQSKEEAEAGQGHLRFHLTDSHTTNIRVLQKRDDSLWHCNCHLSPRIDVRYKERFNCNRKRPATGSEFDLIAEVTGRKSLSINRNKQLCAEQSIPVERVIQQTLELATGVIEEGQKAAKRPMWSYIVGYSAAMSATMLNWVGKLIPSLGASTAHEVVDIRQRSEEPSNTVVKRFKLQHSYPHDSSALTEPSVKAANAPGLTWASDPTRWIGKDKIEQAFQFFKNQLDNLEHGRSAIGGTEWNTIQKQLQPEHDVVLTTTLHHFLSDQFGPVADSDPREERLEKWTAALAHYRVALENLLSFMDSIYMKPEPYAAMQIVYPKPPSPFVIEKAELRLTCRDAAEFLVWLVKIKDAIELPTRLAETLTRMIADAKAVNKRELLPSWTEFPGHNHEAQGNRKRRDTTKPLDPNLICDEIPIDEFDVEPSYALQYPARVATPQKKRKVTFESPTEGFTPPRNAPAKTMSAWNHHWKDEPLMNEEAGERVDDGYQLSYYGGEHSDFLDDLREQAQARYPKKETGFYATTAEERDFQRKRDEKMRKEADRRKDLIARRKTLKNPALTLDTKRKVVNERPADVETPDDIRNLVDKNSGDRRRGARCARKEATLLKKAQKVDDKPDESEDPDQRHEKIDLVFFETDDDEIPILFPDQNLTIAEKKLVELDLARQLREDWERAMLYELKEQEEKHREEELRKQEEERRRREEERQRREEEKRRKEAEEAAARSGLRAPAAPLFPGVLSDYWNQKISAIKKADASAELCKTLNRGQSLHRRDFEEKLLPKQAWLNDDVIDGVLLHAADWVNKKAGANPKKPKCAALTAEHWRRKQTHGVAGCGRMLRSAGITKDSFLDIETILVPICDANHWTLAVVRPQLRTITHMDSMRGGYGISAVKEDMVQWVRDILQEKFVEAEWELVDYDAPRQTNGYDCGMFIIMNGLCIALGVDPQQAYKAGDLGQLRRRLAAILLNGGFTGEFSLDHV